MISSPKLVMLDEPSEGIMPVLVDEMFELFATMKAQGTTILLVEQNVELALGIADRAYIIDQGGDRPSRCGGRNYSATARCRNATAPSDTGRPSS